VPTAFKISTTNPAYRTKDGVKAGTQYRNARRLLGKPFDYASYPTGSVATWSGLQADIDTKGFILDLAVFAPD